MAESDQSQETVTESESESDGAISTEDEKAPLGVTLEDVGAGRKRLTIEIPEQRITTKLDASYTQLNSDALIPGFRRGRAPRRLIERRFSSAVREDACGELVSESFSEAVESHELRVVGEPDIQNQEDLKLPDAGGMSFEVEVEVIPQIELPELEGIAVSRYRFDVTDDDVAKAIDRFRARFGEFIEVEGGIVDAGDWLTADVRVDAGEDPAADAEPITHHTEAFLMVPPDDVPEEGHIVGLAVEDFRSRVVGKKKGDTITIAMTGPPSHENEAIRDQPITITARLDKVERRQLCTVEQLVEHFGMDKEEALQSHLRERLQDDATQRGTHNLRDQITDHLIEAVTLDLPEGLTGRQTERLLRRNGLQLAANGMPEEEVEQALAKSRGDSQRDATRQLKLFFILSEAADKLDVQVTPAEVNGQVASMARDRGRRPEKLRQEMQRSGELENVFMLLRDMKTLDTIIEKANITDVDEPPPSDNED